MTRYLYLCFLINFLIFIIPILYNLYYYSIVEEYKDSSDYGEAYFFIICISVCFSIYALIHSLAIIFSRKIETFYRFKNPFIIVFFIVLFICFFIINKIIKKHGKNSIIYKNIERQENIADKIALVEKYIKYFEKELDYNNSKEKNTTLKNTLNLLEQIKDELDLVSTAVDVNMVTQSFKDIELQANSLDQLQTELDKMKAYRSLNDISCELEDLMKKFDKK